MIEILFKVIDYIDRMICILFGDGVGVILLERDENILSFIVVYMGINGDGGIYLYRINLFIIMNGILL